MGCCKLCCTRSSRDLDPRKVVREELAEPGEGEIFQDAKRHSGQKKKKYSLVNKQFAIENGHRNSGFSH